MKIWIIDPYSEIPNDKFRDGRYFLISKVLSESGYQVKFFLSMYSHNNKIQNNIKEFYYNENLHIIPIETAYEYKNHISISRIKFENDFSKKVYSQNQIFGIPDIIILKDPALFLFENLKPFFIKFNVKLILDIIDLWPELFSFKLPPILRKTEKLIFHYFYKKRNNIYKYASGFSAVSPDYTQHLVEFKVPKEIIYWGINSKFLDFKKRIVNKDFLKSLNLPAKKESECWIIYSGTLGENYDIKTLILVAKELNKENKNIKFIVAGSGPLSGSIEKASNELHNFYYLGTLSIENLFNLYQFCDVGLSIYSPNSTVSMPIKCYDYFAAGLPIINSLNSNLSNLIIERKLGLQYIASNKNSLKEAINSINNDPKDLEIMKLNCLLISKEFDNAIQYNKYPGLISNLVNNEV